MNEQARVIEQSRRRADLARIHIAQKELNLPEEVYCDLKRKVTKGKKDSCANMTNRELNALLVEFIGLGWKPSVGKFKPGRRRQEVKIKAMWDELFELGLVRQGNEESMNIFSSKITGVSLLSLATIPALQKVIEALKAMKERGRNE